MFWTFVLLGAACTATAQPKGAVRLSTTSVAEFLETVSKSNEEAATELTTFLSQSTNGDAKSYAQMVIEDRQVMGRDLEKLAMEKKSATRAATKAQPAAAAGSPAGKGGDPAFLERQAVKAQREAKAFAEAATEHQDAEVRAFAAKHLSMFRKHEKEARRVLPLVQSL